MRLSIALLLACFLVLPATAAAAPTLPEGFEEIALTTGSLGASTGVAFAPDGRAFVAEKDGYVRVVSPSGVVRPEPLLDISAHVNAWSDRGLLGIAVDKDFADNGYLYLLYVYESAPGDPSGPKVSRLTRVTVRPDNTIDGGETTILGTASDNPCPGSSNTSDCIPADFYWHTIGTVRVDPVDGSLWVGTGDANPELVGPTTYAPYDENTYRGKILHIDRNGNGLPGHPFCPGDGDLTHVCTKVYAKGFRNPFRFTLRPGQGPIVGDVGAESEEEVDLTVPGGNYGWPCYEGTVHTPVFQDSAGCEAEYAKEGTPDDTALAPDYSYEHNGGSSVLAGPLYTGAGYPPSYRNSIFIADYAQRWVKRLRLDDAGHVASVSDFASYPDGEGPLFVDMQTLPDGNVGYLDLGWSGTPGLREWRYSGDNHTPVPRASADPVGGRAPLVVHFDGSASSDPDGDDISYDWDFGDGQSGTGARPDHTYTAEGTYYATLTVRDDRGASARLQVGPITPGNLPPLPKITAPVSCSTFRYGSKLALAGSATDPQDGKVPGTALSWHVLQHHTNHLHDYGVFTGSKAIVPTGTDHDSDTYFIVTLTATDSR
ncbi:MAG: hypothetical protein QOJ07_3006, partial [Thermoleophilaceae bacterium]|nr:hypothetical protein [Thermoleophilaceae bacterium]